MTATKNANVTDRVQPKIKQQAGAILEQIGLPVSVLIDTLSRQIIITGGVPYGLTVPKLPTRGAVSFHDGKGHPTGEKRPGNAN